MNDSFKSKTKVSTTEPMWHELVQAVKNENKCGCAFVVDKMPQITVKKRLPPVSSVFNAEMYAIFLALKIIVSSEDNEFVIFTDGLSALQFIDNNKMDHRIKLNILKILNSTNKDIFLEWVPGHANIKGNELADLAAKSALDNRQIVKF